MNVNFDLPMESFEALRSMAKAEHQSAGVLLRELVQQALFMEGYLDISDDGEYVAKEKVI